VLDGKPEAFNARFAGLQISATGTVGLRRESLSVEDAAAWDGAPIGTKVAWINRSPKARAPFEYEHAIKVHRGKAGDPDRYVAHPFTGEHTEAEIKDLLAQQASDYPWVYEITNDVVANLDADGLPADVRQSLVSVTGQVTIGMRSFLDLPPLMTLRTDATQRKRDPADVQRWINMILRRARRLPTPNETEAEKQRQRYLDDNIAREILQVPK
jgi:hypothetical protein